MTMSESVNGQVSEYRIMWRELGLRPLTARSIIGSALLGSRVPSLSTRGLIRFAELFDVPEGTTRVALSRMAAAGELRTENGRYWLAGPLLQRQGRQQLSLTPHVLQWNGDWAMEVVAVDRRDPADRVTLRTAMHGLMLAELREGVWMRPDNLDPGRLREHTATVRSQCEQFLARPHTDPAWLAGRLWDLGGWAEQASTLRARMAELQGPIDGGEIPALAPGFILVAAVTHHLLADPLLPQELLPSWWPAAALREDWQRFDGAWQTLLRAWFEASR